MPVWVPTIRLIEKNTDPPTGVTVGGLIDGDLTPFFNSVSITNVGIRLTNNAIINLDIPYDGKFIRTAPILTDENTRNNYLVELKITQGANSTKLLRAELGKPEIKIDENGAEVLQIPCKGIEFAPKEVLESGEDLFTSPKDRITNVIARSSNQSGANSTKIDIGTINLPDNLTIQQNWIPNGPTPVGRLFEEVIFKLEEPPSSGGTLKDYFYDFTPHGSLTRTVILDADEFGAVSSGAVINPITVNAGASDEELVTTDNEIYRNLVVARGAQGAGSLPTDFMRWASKYNHGIFREEWDTSVSYVIGSLVRYNDPLTEKVRFFKAKTAHSGINPVTGSSGNWLEDFTTIPDWNTDALYQIGEIVYRNVAGTIRFYEATTKHKGSNPPSANWTEITGADVTSGDHVHYFPYSPWTYDLDDIMTNFSGDLDLPAGYVGAFADMNVVRALYDRIIQDDYNESVSVKYIVGFSNSEPTLKYDGIQYVIGVPTSTDASLPSDSDPNKTIQPSGHLAPGINPWIRVNWGRIATWIAGADAHWYLSEDPFDDNLSPRKRDQVNDAAYGATWKWNSTLTAKSPNGGWEYTQHLSSTTTFDKTSIFHLVDDVNLVAGATGIPGQAMEFEFNWDFDLLLTNRPNRTSRGAWWNMFFPFPRFDSPHGNAGHEYGALAAFPYLNARNLDRNSDGDRGWNYGLDSEELGQISSITFKLKLAVYKDAAKTELMTGFANMPMIFWAIDKFDRVYFQEFVQRFNGEWELHTIPFGLGAPQNYFFSRIDEFATLFGYTLPYDFFLKEKEYSGVEFNWRYVKAIGIQAKTGYATESNLYIGGAPDVIGDTQDLLTQLWNQGAQAVNGLLNGEPDPIDGKFYPRTVTLTIDELRFDKELYATSQDSHLTDCVMTKIDETQEDDYDNLKAITVAKQARLEFFPQFYHITALGDPRVQLGKRFTLSGPRVPSPGFREMVCAEVTHTIDATGYYMDIVGVRKFVLP